MNKTIRTYEVYENNAGGITIFILENGKIIDGFMNFEYEIANGKTLETIINEIEDNDGWDSSIKALIKNEEINATLEEVYEECTDGELIASGDF